MVYNIKYVLKWHKSSGIGRRTRLHFTYSLEDEAAGWGHKLLECNFFYFWQKKHTTPKHAHLSVSLGYSKEWHSPKASVCPSCESGRNQTILVLS